MGKLYTKIEVETDLHQLELIKRANENKFLAFNKELKNEAKRLLEKYKEYGTAYGYLESVKEQAVGISWQAEIDTVFAFNRTDYRRFGYETEENGHAFFLCESEHTACRIAMVFNLEGIEPPFSELDTKQINEINKQNSKQDKKLKRGIIKDVFNKNVEGLIYRWLDLYGKVESDE
jgi:hypothetical protein|tara:strand:+ start:2677 stop:3204 length:528 start_codon:yes stop_codon:yes gene_type:complete